MSTSGMAGQGGRLPPTGEKYPRLALVDGEQAMHTGAHSDLRPHSGQSGSRSPLNHHLLRQLRVVLVDGDQGAHDFVRQAFAAHAKGWVLDSHHGPDTVLAALRRPGIRHSARPAPSAHELSTLPTINQLPETGHAPPDFILLDTDRPAISGVDAVRRLVARLPKLRVMMFTSCSEGATIIRAVGAGACGYLIKPVPPRYLVYAVSEAAAGRAIFCSEAQTAMVE